MNRFQRLVRHLTTTRRAGRRAFPAVALAEIQQAIAQGERLHRAEVRIIIEPSLDILDVFQGATSRMRARELFSEYAIWDTEENTGVLVYVNLADHKVEIIADRVAGRALQPQDWQAVCRTMTDAFRQGAYRDGAVAGLMQLNDLLHRHFPDDGSTENQLSNRPVML